MAGATQMLGEEENRNVSVGGGGSWYGIFSPSIPPIGAPRVYTEVAVAVVESKKVNGRFKRFGSEQEARLYAETGHLDSPVRRVRTFLKENTEKSPARKRSLNYRSGVGEETLSVKACPSVPTRELSRFKQAIEKTDMETVEQCMKDNPRYLVSAYDKPVTLQQACHYNALHCAAKLGNLEVAERIMTYLLSEEPWRKLYPSEDVQSSAHLERRSIVIDCYFNTSDKGCGETPLHFACKFGHLSFVRWLLSFSQVDITRRNKSDETAQEVAGSRCAEAEDIREQVDQLVQESRHSVFVPVVRSIDNSTPPFLGQPVTPEYIYFKKKPGFGSKIVLGELSMEDSILSSDFQSPDTSLLNTSIGTTGHSPLSPALSICAYAGPMKASDAREFRRVWKTPPRELSSRRRDIVQGIMRSDSERGLERVGRDLAVQQRVPWREYWPFMDAFVNLREEDGLVLLEKYLADNLTCFISSDTPSKADRDVLLALPPGGVTQLGERFPYICHWYSQVLAFPEDERRCWTTPIRVRKKKEAPNLLNENVVLQSTPIAPSKTKNNANIEELGIARNLMSDLSLEESNIQDILVDGLTNLSVNDSKRLFSPQPSHTAPKEALRSSTPKSSQPVPKDPITALPPPTSQKWASPHGSEARLRYAKPPSSATPGEMLGEEGEGPAGNRRYLTFQAIRWIALFFCVWFAYFGYVYMTTELPD